MTESSKGAFNQEEAKHMLSQSCLSYKKKWRKEKLKEIKSKTLKLKIVELGLSLRKVIANKTCYICE